MGFKNKKFELDKLENVLYDLIDKHIENIKDWDPFQVKILKYLNLKSPA